MIKLKHKIKGKKELLFVSIKQQEFIPICPSNWGCDTAISSASTDSDLSSSPTDVDWSRKG